MFLSLLIAVILGILEVTVAWWPLTFLWVICFSMINPEKESFWLAFLAGVYADFLKGEILGKTSLVFLGFSLMVALYRRKFKVEHPLYFFPFVAVSYLIFNFFEFREPLMGSGHGFGVLWSMLIAAVLFKVAQVLTPKKEEIKL